MHIFKLIKFLYKNSKFDLGAIWIIGEKTKLNKAIISFVFVFHISGIFHGLNKGFAWQRHTLLPQIVIFSYLFNIIVFVPLKNITIKHLLSSSQLQIGIFQGFAC